MAFPLTTVVPYKSTSQWTGNRATSETNREKHIGHVLFDGSGIRNDVGGLADTGTLARENGLIDAEAARDDGEQSAIGGYFVSHGNIHNITRD